MKITELVLTCQTPDTEGLRNYAYCINNYGVPQATFLKPIGSDVLVVSTTLREPSYVGSGDLAYFESRADSRLHLRLRLERAEQARAVLGDDVEVLIAAIYREYGMARPR